MNRNIKTFTALLLAAALVFSLVGCGKKEEPKTEVVIADSLELLTTVWGSYSDGEKFPSAGGNYASGSPIMDAPGNFDVKDTQMLDYVLGLPESEADKIDDAASLMHMMNANTFTCGAYRLIKAEDAAAVAEAIGNNLDNRLWMCGFPDKMVVMSVGSYLVSAFGSEGLVDNFRDKTAAAYPTAEVLIDKELL